MESHNEIIKRSVIAALDSANDPRAIDVLIDNAVKGRFPRQRTAAVRALEDFTDQQRVVDALNNLLFTKNRWVKTTVLKAIEKANNKSSISYLEKLMAESGDKDLKNSIRKVLDKMR